MDRFIVFSSSSIIIIILIIVLVLYFTVPDVKQFINNILTPQTTQTIAPTTTTTVAPTTPQTTPTIAPTTTTTVALTTTPTVAPTTTTTVVPTVTPTTTTTVVPTVIPTTTTTVVPTVTPTTTSTVAPTIAPTTIAATEWNCITKDGLNWAPLRIGNSGDTECAAKDGKNCLWANSYSQCKIFDKNNLSPLKCGSDHQTLYGNDGYSSTGHWCGTKGVIPQSAEVYYIGGDDYTKQEAENKCKEFGASLATFSQLEQAQKNGADWCSTGWVSDRNTKHYPISWNTASGCGNGSTGVKEWNPEKAGANCWGKKPPVGTPKVLSFSDSTWKQDDFGVEFYSEPNYTGEKLVLNVGKWNLRQFAFADIISSIKVPKGLKVIAYQDFSDVTREILSNVDFMGSPNPFWDNRVTYVDVQKL